MEEKTRTRGAYDAAVESLAKFCEEEAGMEAEILTDRYPFRVRYTPSGQVTIDGEAAKGEITVSVGLTTVVSSCIVFTMPAKTIKKLAALAEKVGDIYYQMFREEAGRC